MCRLHVSKDVSSAFESHFGGLKDPRIDRSKLYPLTEILFVVLAGSKFVREHIIGNYIADFVCREKKLILEIDGGQHMDAMMYDAVRTQYLESRGYRVLRIWNDEVFKNIQGVMSGILQLAKQ